MTHHVEKLLQATNLLHIIKSPDKHYSEYYNDTACEIVAQRFARECVNEWVCELL
jgi:hypothetical protein